MLSDNLVPENSLVLIGRPNVGKSTLFNRLAGRHMALVHDEPGVTRDWRMAKAEFGGIGFAVIDTAGLDSLAAGEMITQMRTQTLAALKRAKVVLFIVDLDAGVLPLDRDIADILRGSGKPVIVVANKADIKKAAHNIAEFYAFGFDNIISVSAEHNIGMGELQDNLRLHFPLVTTEPSRGVGIVQEGEEERRVSQKPLRLAVVGRPNVGKSTLVNKLIGEERMITGPEAGVTRDAIEISGLWNDRPLSIYDTAGMRRKARIDTKLERISVGDTLKAVRFSEVVILMLAQDQALEKQDLALAGLVEREGRAMVLALNKWDQVAKSDRALRLKELQYELESNLSSVKGIALVPVSATKGEGLKKLMDKVLDVEKIWNKRISTAKLNVWLNEVQTRHPAPMVAGRRLSFKYVTQVKARPPTFSLSCSRKGAIPDSYISYLVNSLRAEFGFDGVPMRIVLSEKENPYRKGARGSNAGGNKNKIRK